MKHAMVTNGWPATKLDLAGASIEAVQGTASFFCASHVPEWRFRISRGTGQTSSLPIASMFPKLTAEHLA